MLPRTKELSSTILSDATGVAVVDFNPLPLRNLRSLGVDQLRRSDSADMTSAYSLSWTVTGAGTVRARIVGLDVNTSYFLAVTLK